MCRSPRADTRCCCHPIGRLPRLYPSPGWKKDGSGLGLDDIMTWKRLQIIVCDKNPLVTERMYHKLPEMWTVDTFGVVRRSKLLNNRSSHQQEETPCKIIIWYERQIKKHRLIHGIQDHLGLLLNFQFSTSHERCTWLCVASRVTSH